MSADGATEPSPRLAVVASVLQAYRNVLGRPRRLFVIAVLPATLCMILSGAYFRMPWQDHPLSVLYFSTLLIPMSYLALAWSRYSLWSDNPRFVIGRPWVTAYTKVLAYFVCWALCHYLWPVIPITIFILLAYGLFGQGDALSTVLPFVPMTWLCLVLIGLTVFARFFLALPLIVAARPASPLAVWRAGAGAGLRLGGAVFLLALVYLLLTVLCLVLLSEAILALLPLLALPVIDLALHDTLYLRSQLYLYLFIWIILPFASVVGTALFAELLATVFRETAGWNNPGRSILERFD